MKSSTSGTTTPNAALSRDGSTVAVVLPSLERRILQVFQVESGLLQTTLNARQSSSLLSKSSNTTTSVLGSDSLEKVVFCGNNHVVALSNSNASTATSTNAVHSQVLIWDLTRGGVVAHAIGGSGDTDTDEFNSSSKQYLDVCTNGDHVFLLVAVSASDSSSRRSSSGTTKSGGDDDEDDSGAASKLQIHQYDPASGRLMRKIKCGKATALQDTEFGLAVITVTGSLQFVVRNGNTEAFRIIDAETGNKVLKQKYRDAKGKAAAKKDGTGGTGILALNNFVLVPRISTVAVFCNKAKGTGQWLKAIASSTPNPTVRVWNAEATDGSILVLVDDKLYHCSAKEGPKEISKLTTVDHVSTVIPHPSNSKQATVVLHNPNDARSSYQIQLLDWTTSSSGDDDVSMIASIPDAIELRWVSPDDVAGGSATSKAAASSSSSATKKRNVESITVLGPGQAGAENATVSERTQRKKKKTGEASNDDDDEEDNDEMEVDEEDEDEEVDFLDQQDPTMGMSIAERLKALSEAHGEANEEDDDEVDIAKAASRTNFVVKRATTESLTQLLTQALRGGDDGLLELALSVKDKNILQATMIDLDRHCIDILLTKLTTRLASKPQRAEDLGMWLSYVLESGRVSQLGQLQPLKNLLQDRIDAFPHLLRLEGRLSMVNAKKRRGRTIQR